MSWCIPPEVNEFGDDYLDWSDDDNDVCNSKYVISSSSDEDAEQFLERIKSRRFVKKAKVSDGKDDFEREMASELSMTMQQLTASFYKKSTPGATSSSTENASESKAPEEESEFYDEIYFDSDDSDSEELSHNKTSGSTSRKGNRRILSNDELFYDPKMDDRDQAWMDKMRRSYQVKNKKRSSGDSKASQKSQPLPESDAVLNCPACLTMLCMDCQRHEIYHNQYRAMFVFNCNIDWTEVLKFPKKNQKKEFFKNKKKLKKMQEKVKQTPSGQQEVKETSSLQEVIKQEEIKQEVIKQEEIKQEVKETSSLQEVIKQEEIKQEVIKQEEIKQEEIKQEVIKPEVKEPSSLQEEIKQEEVKQEVKEMPSSQQENDVEVKDISGDKNVSMVDAKKTDGSSNPVGAESTNKILVSGRELETSVSTNMLRENVCFGNNPEELFHPVTCKICNTKVAVYDKEEVYHFFNIVTSY